MQDSYHRLSGQASRSIQKRCSHCRIHESWTEHYVVSMDPGPRIPSIRNHSLLTEHNLVEFVEACAATNMEYKNAILKNDVLRGKDIVNDLEENRVKGVNEDFANPRRTSWFMYNCRCLPRVYFVKGENLRRQVQR